MIRLMQIADYKEVYSLWDRTEGVGLSDSDSEEQIARFLNRNQGLSFIYFDNGIIIGTILCGHDGRRGYIHHLVVDEHYRGQKIGRQLVTRSLEKLKEDKILKCHLFVFEKNHIGKSFWSGTGWKKREDLLIYSKTC